MGTSFKVLSLDLGHTVTVIASRAYPGLQTK